MGDTFDRHSKIAWESIETVGPRSQQGAWNNTNFFPFSCLFSMKDSCGRNRKTRTRIILPEPMCVPVSVGVLDYCIQYVCVRVCVCVCRCLMSFWAVLWGIANTIPTFITYISLAGRYCVLVTNKPRWISSHPHQYFFSGRIRTKIGRFSCRESLINRNDFHDFGSH
jgi:hypothetical protein